MSRPANEPQPRPSPSVRQAPPGSADEDVRRLPEADGRIGSRRRSPNPSRPAPLTLDEARRWARVGVLAALALVLGYVETFIPLPLPVPGIKLGLGNIAVLTALVLLDARSAVAVAAIKVLAAGFLFGNPLMMLYSAAGTVLAFAAMALIVRAGASVVLAAIVGAVMHNLGQLAMAALVLGTGLVWASAPVLVVAACVTGSLTGAATRSMLACVEGSL